MDLPWTKGRCDRGRGWGFEHACDVTCDAMRRPEVWSRVAALADELERSGSMCPDAIAEFLPEPEAAWPPSGAARWRDQYSREQVELGVTSHVSAIPLGSPT